MDVDSENYTGGAIMEFLGSERVEGYDVSYYHIVENVIDVHIAGHCIVFCRTRLIFDTYCRGQYFIPLPPYVQRALERRVKVLFARVRGCLRLVVLQGSVVSEEHDRPEVV